MPSESRPAKESPEVARIRRDVMFEIARDMRDLFKEIHRELVRLDADGEMAKQVKECVDACAQAVRNGARRGVRRK